MVLVRPDNEITFMRVLKNNGWKGFIGSYFDEYKLASEEEKQKGIELGKELYAHHFYEIIDSKNAPFYKKMRLERMLYNKPMYYFYLYKMHENHEKIIFLRDYENKIRYIIVPQG